MKFPFNVRVYGILIHQSRILVTDEIIGGTCFTKFPGGGLEYGEGTRECLRREFMEEVGIDVTVHDHLYTTDDFIPSAFRPNEQVLSIYYRVSGHLQPDLSLLRTEKCKFYGGEAQTFRWIDLADLSPDDFELPIDKRMVKVIKDLAL